MPRSAAITRPETSPTPRASRRSSPSTRPPAPTTRPAGSASDPTAISTTHPATAASRRPVRRTSTACSARSCASTCTLTTFPPTPRATMRCPPTTPSSARPAPTKFMRSACATRGGRASTADWATSISPTSATSSTRRSTSARRARTTAGPCSRVRLSCWAERRPADRRCLRSTITTTASGGRSPVATFYRGEGEALQGQYFFADFVQAKVFTLRFDGSAWVATDQTSQVMTDAGALTNPTSFGEDARGNLYLTDLDGEVFRLTPTVASADQADVLRGLASNDMLFGGSGNDTLDGGPGADIMLGGACSDMADYSSSAAGVTVNLAIGVGAGGDAQGDVLGGIENIIGSAQADMLTGDGNANTLDGGGGADVMASGAGDDTYVVDHAGDMVIENAGAGTDTVFSTAHLVLPANVENLTLSGSADLQGYGNGDTNTLTGNAGSNLLDGRGGADVMRGGVGNDVYVVDNAGDQVIENAGEGNDAAFSTAHLVLSADVETLVLQGSADLQGYGNSLANALFGNAGGNLLDGRVGADYMAGGAGNDVYFVDDAGDMVIENIGEGNDAIFSTVHLALPANVEILVLQGSADLQGYGNGDANMLYGNAGGNLLDGRGGADAMLGGAGNDVYVVDNAGDMVIENANEGSDAVFATVDYTLTANVETLVLQGSGNLAGTGNTLANGIYGNSGNNTLDGGAAADLLTGNAGDDAFVFHVGEAGGDMVVDFAGNGAAVGDSLQFVGYGAGATFTNIDATHWQVNYNSGGSHEVITFLNGASIDAADFAFV